jgi:hypothetical protein
MSTIRPVNQIPDGAEQKIGHAHHQVNTLVISLGFLQWIVAVILRTGGGRDRFLSGRTGIGGARQGQDDDQSQRRQQDGQPLHAKGSERANAILRRSQGEG